MKLTCSVLALMMLATATAQGGPSVMWTQNLMERNMTDSVAFKNPVTQTGAIVLGGALGSDVLTTGPESFIGQAISATVKSGGGIARYSAAGDVYPGTTRFVSVGGCSTASCMSYVTTVASTDVVPVSMQDVTVSTTLLNPVAEPFERFSHAAVWAKLGMDPGPMLYAYGGVNATGQVTDELVTITPDFQTNTYMATPMPTQDAQPRAQHCMLAGPLMGGEKLISFFGIDASMDSTNAIAAFDGSAWTMVPGPSGTVAPRSGVSCARVDTDAGPIYFAFGGLSMGQPINEIISVTANGLASIVTPAGRTGLIPSGVFGASAMALSGATYSYVSVVGGEASQNVPSPYIQQITVDTSALPMGSPMACPEYSTLNGTLPGNPSSWEASVGACQAAAQDGQGRCGCVSEAAMKLSAYRASFPGCDVAAADSMRATSWLDASGCQSGSPTTCISFYPLAQSALTQCLASVPDATQMCSCVTSSMMQMAQMDANAFSSCPAYAQFTKEAGCSNPPPSCFTNRADALAYCRLRRGNFAFTCNSPTTVTCPPGTIYDGGDRGCVPICQQQQ